jgi:hypothetical protein
MNMGNSAKMKQRHISSKSTESVKRDRGGAESWRQEERKGGEERYGAGNCRKRAG